jgi:uncharacterized membrane protein
MNKNIFLILIYIVTFFMICKKTNELFEDRVYHIIIGFIIFALFLMYSRYSNYKVLNYFKLRIIIYYNFFALQLKYFLKKLNKAHYIWV